MDKPLITVIIPVYKVERFLCRCVDSVLTQTYTNLKIILVDDGSPDGCPEICDRYAVQDPRIVVIHKPNGGQSSARNAALDYAHGGQFIFFLDSDDYLHPQAIEILLKIRQEHDADMVQCQFIRGCENSFPEIKIDYKCKLYDNTTIFHSREQSLCIWGALYKTDLWNGIRMPLGAVNEDDATSWQVYFRAKKIAISPLPLYYYYENNESTMACLQQQLRLDFINHYHERIGFFRGRNMKLLTQLSQWRFCLPLMILGVCNHAATEEQRAVMWTEFKENVGGVIVCPKVPLTHKFLFILYRCFPKTCHFFGVRFHIRS